MESATAPAAGWFPDPGGSTSERWWSGDAWTEHTRQPLGAAVPEAFAAHVGTLVEERVVAPVEAPAEAPPEERVPEFAFAMTATEATADNRTVRSAVDELAHPGRHVAPLDAEPESESAPTAPAAGPSRPPVPAALLEAQASAAPVMTVPLVDPEPSIALPTAPAPAPVATAAAATASAMPGFTMPSFTEPNAPQAAAPHSDAQPSARPAPDASAQPAFATPTFAEPVAPAPAAAAAEGFVMPNLATPLVMPDEAPAPLGRHADEPAYVPEAPKQAAPAPAPVGFTSSADPTIANRYRQAMHAPEQPEADPLGAPLGTPLAPTLGGSPAPLGTSPAQPGWAGMPLPGPGGAAPGYAPAPGGYAAPGAAPGFAPAAGLAPTPGYAPTPSYAPASYAAPTGSNKAAKLALSSGISSLAALAFIIFGRILIVPSILSLVAIVAGIVGLVLARRAGVGKWSALGGLLMGIATSVTLTVSLVVTVMGAFALDTSLVEDDIVANAAPLYGVDVVSANCPDDVSALTTTSFTCTAFDSSGGAYLVEVELTDDGHLSWELQL
jgi:hypothetical protein